MKDEKAHQLEAELDKLQADGPAAWAKLPEEELFTPAGFSEERAEATSYSNYSYWGSTFRAFFKNRVAVLLLVALIAVVAFAFLQPYLPGQADPNLCAEAYGKRFGKARRTGALIAFGWKAAFSDIVLLGRRGFASAEATRGLCDRPLDCFASPSKFVDGICYRETRRGRGKENRTLCAK